MKRFGYAILMLIVLPSCVTTKEWVATGGSRSDGVVKLSYEYGEFEKAKLNEQQGIELAIQKCKAWGYASAEAFGGVTKVCNVNNGFGDCSQWLVTKEYQCTSSN